MSFLPPVIALFSGHGALYFLLPRPCKNCGAGGKLVFLSLRRAGMRRLHHVRHLVNYTEPLLERGMEPAESHADAAANTFVRDARPLQVLDFAFSLAERCWTRRPLLSSHALDLILPPGSPSTFVCGGLPYRCVRGDGPQKHISFSAPCSSPSYPFISGPMPGGRADPQSVRSTGSL